MHLRENDEIFRSVNIFVKHYVNPRIPIRTDLIVDRVTVDIFNNSDYRNTYSL